MLSALPRKQCFPTLGWSILSNPEQCQGAAGAANGRGQSITTAYASHQIFSSRGFCRGFVWAAHGLQGMRSRASENWVWQSFVLGKGRLASWKDEWLVSGCLGNLKIFVVQRFAHFLVLCIIFWHKWMLKALYIHLRDNLAWEIGNMLIIGAGCNVSLFSVWLICLRHLHFQLTCWELKLQEQQKRNKSSHHNLQIHCTVSDLRVIMFNYRRHFEV